MERVRMERERVRVENIQQLLQSPTQAAGMAEVITPSKQPQLLWGWCSDFLVWLWLRWRCIT